MRFKLGVVALAAAALFTSAAVACGPSRSREVTSVEIDAPAARVWDVVANYRDMAWTGRIVKTESVHGMAPEIAKRRLTFSSGAVLTDTVVSVEPDQRSLTFRTDEEDWKELPVEGYVSKITVREVDGRSIVEWRGAFSRAYLKNDPPPELSDDAAIAAVIQFQNASLAGLKRRLESKM